MKKHKQPIRPTNDSERSPAVHYANWKETIFLQKNLATINKTERSILNRITVDQKVMFRRFQRMLTRTKMTQARVADDKQLIKQLHGEYSRRLHCESHLVNAEDAEFLGKLEKNPCVFDSVEAKRKFLETQKSARSKLEITDEELLLLVQNVMKNGDVNCTPGNLRRLSALGSILDTARCIGQEGPTDNSLSVEKIPSLRSDLRTGRQGEFLTSGLIGASEKNKIDIKFPSPSNFKGRPLTTNNTQNHHLGINDFGRKSLSDVTTRNTRSDGASESIDSSVTESSNDNSSKGTPTKHNDITDRPRNENEFLLSLATPPNRNNIVALERKVGTTSVNSMDDSDVNNRKGLGKNKKVSDAASTKMSLNLRSTKAVPRKRVTSIFDEMKRPDMHGMRLQEAKLADFSGQVKDFIEDLSNLGQGVPDFDYYASKMQMDAALQVKPLLPPELPATPDDVYRKHTGDTTIKCITLPKLKVMKGDCDDKYDNSDVYDILLHQSLFYDSSESVSSGDFDEDDVIC